MKGWTQVRPGVYKPDAKTLKSILAFKRKAASKASKRRKRRSYSSSSRARGKGFNYYEKMEDEKHDEKTL